MIRILKYGEIADSEIFSRGVDLSAQPDVQNAVAGIIENVRLNGDTALLQYCASFDGFKAGSARELEAAEAEFSEAANEVGSEMMAVLTEAAENIKAFHEKQLRQGFELREREGIILGQRVLPIEKVGLYIPGGTAAYPSTVLMNLIPAIIAGCAEIVITTPSKGGRLPAGVLAAISVAEKVCAAQGGTIRVFKLGGAQAVAALAFGTETVPKVYKITGPGNVFVSEAKRRVYGLVDIDMIAGPSEILVIADKNTDPAKAAADLLSQAEHDVNASAVMVTDSAALAYSVAEEIERQLKTLAREEIARASIEQNGKIIVCESIDTAIDIANEIAPEHLELCVSEPFALLDKVKNAGSVFLGYDCPEALGDYFSGPNHTLPTSGTAKFASPLSVDAFVKKMQYSYYTKEAAAAVADKVALFARAEGLTGHAASVLLRK